MIDPSLFIAFCLASAALVLTPGPVVSIVIANAATHGARRALWTVAGAALAMTTHLAVVSAGLASLTAIMAEAFVWLKWIGAAYLVWLGVQAWRRADAVAAAALTDGPAAAARRGGPRELFLSGVMAGLFNPKALLFFAAFLPQFVSPVLPTTPQLAIMSGAFIAIAVTLDTCWAALGARVGRWLNARAALRERLTGAVLVLAGVWVAALRRA